MRFNIFIAAGKGVVVIVVEILILLGNLVKGVWSFELASLHSLHLVVTHWLVKHLRLMDEAWGKLFLLNESWRLKDIPVLVHIVMVVRSPVKYRIH